MKQIQIEIPIYYGIIHLIISDDFKQVKQHFKIKENVEGYGAFVWEEENEQSKVMEFFVCVPPNIEDDLIVHEAIHLVNLIFISKGIRLSRKNDETQAHFTGWIFRQIQQQLIKFEKRQECGFENTTSQKIKELMKNKK